MRPSVRTSFRLAAASEAGELVALVESAYRGQASRAGWTTEADLLGGQRTDREEVGAVLDDPRAALLVACCGERLAGCVCVRVGSERVAHIGLFAVSPALQGCGLGAALLAEAERVARERGALRAEMTVIEQRAELLAWYARRGHLPTGETRPFPYGDPRFGLPKRDDLRFLVLSKPLEPASDATRSAEIERAGTAQLRQAPAAARSEEE